MKRRIIEFCVLLAVAIGAGPVGASIWSWSTTAGSNDSADPSINWREGMAPSAVNDSARAMMASLAQWRSDISATNTTTGTGTAYLLTTLEGVNTSPSNGQMLAAIFHATNGAAATLTVDGGNAYPIWLNGSAVPAGTLVAGSPYRFAFNSGNSAWVLEGGFASPFSTALGAIMLSTAPTPPNSNFVAPYGQCISTTTYAAYWVQQGSPASGACPGGQFAIIDMRGRVPTALDTLPGSTAANRLTSSATGCGVAFTSVGTVCTNESQSTTISNAMLPPYTPSVSDIHLSNATSGGAQLYGWTGSGGASYGSPTGGGTILLPVSAMALVNGGAISATFNAQGGTSTPFTRIAPNIGLIPYLRIL